MKKFTLIHLIIVAVIALVAGLFIGMAVNSSGLKKDDLAGSIGKVDRYRNVKVTEEDVQLRNELVDDTAKLTMYEKYLTYFYYKSIRTSKDIETVLKKSQEVENFYRNSENYVKTLTNHKEFLENTRPDILNALNMLVTLDKESSVPLVGYLNIAQNSITRIRNQGQLMMNFIDALAAFTAEVPPKTYPGLEDASDILTLNMMELAVMSQDKPVLKYLENTKLKNDEEGIKEFKAEELFRNELQVVIFSDAESLSLGNSEQLNIYTPTGNSEQLNNLLDNMEQLGNILNIVDVVESVLSNEVYVQAVNNATQLGYIVLNSPVGVIESIGSEVIFNSDQLNAVGSYEQ